MERYSAKTGFAFGSHESETPTLRDQFAMAALTGLISTATESVYADVCARSAYELADAMMAERERGK